MEKLQKKIHEVEQLKASAPTKRRLTPEEKQQSVNLSAQKYYYKNREAILAKARERRSKQNQLPEQQNRIAV